MSLAAGAGAGGLGGGVSYDAQRLSYDLHIICICMTTRDDKEDFLHSSLFFFAKSAEVNKLPRYLSWSAAAPPCFSLSAVIACEAEETLKPGSNHYIIPRFVFSVSSKAFFAALRSDTNPPILRRSDGQDVECSLGRGFPSESGCGEVPGVAGKASKSVSQWEGGGFPPGPGRAG